MIRVECPTGCPGYLQRPFSARAQPVRCANCRAWLRVAAEVEDGALVTGVLLARPGEELARDPRPPSRALPRIPARLALPVGLAVALVVAFLWSGPVPALVAAGLAYAAGLTHRPDNG